MKNKKILILYTPIILLALIIIVSITAFSRGSLQKGIGEIEVNKDWNKVMAESINRSEIKLDVDGKAIDMGGSHLYMSDNMELMIPADIVIESFDCAANIYENNRIVVEKGSSKAEMYLGKSNFKFNDNDYKFDDKVEKKNGIIYLPVSLFSQYLGYEYTWNSDTNTGSLKNEATGSFLPEEYNYVDEKRDTETKDQGDYGTCWAFATLTALETTLMPEEKFDFSENNLVYNNVLSDKIQDGGDYIMSMAYLMAWKGPVLEKDDPYGSAGSNYNVNASLQPVKHIQGAEIIPSKDYEQIKEMVFKYGGVESSMYMSMNNAESNSIYYNNTEAAYCYKGSKKPNHDVVIIGWDDNYSKDLFNDETIKENGAFICKNSWGSEFGFDGVFYISYEDDCIGTNNVCYTTIEDVDNYDNIYQSDLCGWTGTMGFEGQNTAYFSNVYTAENEEKLQAVGFYAATTDLNYEVFVCENYENKSSLTERNHVAASGKLRNKGYYTIKLDKDYNIDENSKFAVIVKVTNNDGNTFKLIPVEMDANSAVGKVDLTDGEGYFSSAGQNWQSAEQQQCNICLKAYTSNK